MSMTLRFPTLYEVAAFMPTAFSMFLVLSVAAAVSYGQLTPPLLAVAVVGGVAMGVAAAQQRAKQEARRRARG
ncbi:MAG: hypothetical protein EXR52_00980 [Dehalococcoidia bacterium]|nr:hypothetical protein [Dehalococcoidia bacterium]